MAAFPVDAAPENHYLLMLLTGITEAAASNWKLAKLLLWAAYQIGKESGDERITGRDAAYTLAIACRITFRNENDLAQARQYLNLTVSRSAEGRIAALKSGSKCSFTTCKLRFLRVGRQRQTAHPCLTHFARFCLAPHSLIAS